MNMRRRQIKGMQTKVQRCIMDVAINKGLPGRSCMKGHFTSRSKHQDLLSFSSVCATHHVCSTLFFCISLMFFHQLKLKLKSNTSRSFFLPILIINSKFDERYNHYLACNVLFLFLKWLILWYLLLASPGSNIKYPVMWNCNLRSYKDNKLASQPCIFKTCSPVQALIFNILHSHGAQIKVRDS